MLWLLIVIKCGKSRNVPMWLRSYRRTCAITKSTMRSRIWWWSVLIWSILRSRRCNWFSLHSLSLKIIIEDKSEQLVRWIIVVEGPPEWPSGSFRERRIVHIVKEQPNTYSVTISRQTSKQTSYIEEREREKRQNRTYRERERAKNGSQKEKDTWILSCISCSFLFWTQAEAEIRASRDRSFHFPLAVSSPSSASFCCSL